MHDFLNWFRILLNSLDCPVFPRSWCHTLTSAISSLEYSVVVACQLPLILPLENGALWIKTLWYDTHALEDFKEVQSDLSLHHCPPQTYFHTLYVEGIDFKSTSQMISLVELTNKK